MVEPMSFDLAESVIAQDIYSRSKQGPLTSEDIASIVNYYQQLFRFPQEDVDRLIKSLETKYVTTMGAGVSLIDPDIPHDEEWYLKAELTPNYWNDYETLLVNYGWPTRVINSMNSVTDKILGLLNNPSEEGDWERRGLVIGHVQSGKTANYIGLITKAADAGYKFIIVIAGIHNNLRTQTQERIDEGFIGRDSKTQKPIGVGLISPKRGMPVTVTTTESDFNKTVATRFGMQLKSLNQTFILVIKKNVSTLSSLYNWLKALNTTEGLEKIAEIPMLMIDDEADNASINTNKPDLNPTRTNKEIRNILNLFRKRCYVGYTATPFANIFIDPDDKDKKLGHNLFPEHFIYCLDAPTNYFGAEKIFLDEESNQDFIEYIDDSETEIPLQHKKSFIVQSLPTKLKIAIRTFVLSRAIRNLRGQGKNHCSMMINVSRFVDVQRQVRQLTEDYVNELRRAIRFNYKLPADIAIKDSFIAQLYQDFCSEYLNSGHSWNVVLEALGDAAEAVKVFVVNSNSDEAPDYATYSKQGNALTAITVGGLSLSRGLTIEGLTISYIYRNSKMYDTLMQMGRWFGYRDNYEDLCRIYMSKASYRWYSHIAQSTEELRAQIKRMRREGKKPSDFGLYVRAHPDTLIVTALNKMHYTEQVSFQITYDGQLKETHIIPADERKIKGNIELFKDFFSYLKQMQEPTRDNTKSYLFTDVNWQQVQDFILRFNFHSDQSDLQEHLPTFIKEISEDFPQWDVSFKSLNDKDNAEGLMVASQLRTIGYENNLAKPPKLEPGWYVGNKSKVSGNSNFLIGLDNQQLQHAMQLAKEEKRAKPIVNDYTNARQKPFLLLHIINLVDNDNQSVLSIAPAISVSFPNSNEPKTVEYIVNSVWLKQFEPEQFDSPDEEDDYDIQ